MEKEIEELCNFLRLLNDREDGRSIEEKILSFDDEVLFADIKKFNDFVKKHGHTGGWDPVDHSVFLNYNRKHNLQSVIRLLRFNFPDISDEEIIQHDKWYKKYVELKNLQQRAFKFWNIQKKEKNIRNTSPTSSIDSNNSIKCQKKKDEVKANIQQWKEYKLKVKENEERVNQMKAEQIAKMAKMKKDLQERKKAYLLEYKQKNLQFQKAIWTANQVQENRKIMLNQRKANKMLPMFRQKDEQLIQKIQDKRNIIRQKKEERQMLIDKAISKYRTNIKVERDPNRLFTPTVEWKQKTIKTENEVENVNFFSEPLDITNIPHRAVPKWRKTE